MDDSSSRTQRSGSPLMGLLTVGLILVVAIIAGIAGFTAWHNTVSAGNVDQNSRPAATAPVDAPPPIASANAASGAELRESVSALQSTQRQILDEVESIKQKIAAEQGERKLLTAQIGSLSIRLDELSAASASIAESASTGQSRKRHAKSR